MDSVISDLLPLGRSSSDVPDVVCFCHLRWDFVYQRPQHLMSRFARERRVLFFEEPITRPELQAHVTSRGENVTVVVPHLPPGLSPEESLAAYRTLVDETLERFGFTDFVLWLQTPLALDVARHLEPRAVVYDCMDELSAFKDAPVALRQREAELMARADLVFTGGASLYRAKRERHPRVRLFPSSVDEAHFRPARAARQGAGAVTPGGPRIGYAGVIDERVDIGLVEQIADLRPDWQLMMLGPVVKIDPAQLPQRPNIHYLGFRDYAELPQHFAEWDVGMMPFARNEATRFISPTKTLEYLAAGLPVVSTPIADVVDPYGIAGIVRLGETAAELVEAIEATLDEPRSARWDRADAMLARTSWDTTWRGMSKEIASVLSPATSADTMVAR